MSLGSLPPHPASSPCAPAPPAPLGGPRSTSPDPHAPPSSYALAIGGLLFSESFTQGKNGADYDDVIGDDERIFIHWWQVGGGWYSVNESIIVVDTLSPSESLPLATAITFTQPLILIVMYAVYVVVCSNYAYLVDTYFPRPAAERPRISLSGDEQDSNIIQKNSLFVEPAANFTDCTGIGSMVIEEEVCNPVTVRWGLTAPTTTDHHTDHHQPSPSRARLRMGRLQKICLEKCPR